MKKELLLQFIIIFVITQMLGFAVALTLIKENVKATIISEDIDSVSNAIALIVFILVFTFVLIIIMKLIKGVKPLKAMELLAVFGTSVIVFDSLLPEVSLMLALLVVMSRIILSESVFLKNIASVIAVAGAGALLGVSLGIIPVLVFIILLAVYDLIAVFKTKHMVFLAKRLSSTNMSFTVSLPTKDHVFQLGTGDLIIPMVFGVAVLKQQLPLMELSQAVITPVLILLASVAGLIGTFYFVAKKKQAMPALPLQVVLMIGVYFAAGFF